MPGRCIRRHFTHLCINLGAGPYEDYYRVRPSVPSVPVCSSMKLKIQNRKNSIRASRIRRATAHVPRPFLRPFGAGRAMPYGELARYSSRSLPRLSGSIVALVSTKRRERPTSLESGCMYRCMRAPRFATESRPLSTVCEMSVSTPFRLRASHSACMVLEGVSGESERSRDVDRTKGTGRGTTVTYCMSM